MEILIWRVSYSWFIIIITEEKEVLRDKQLRCLWDHWFRPLFTKLKQLFVWQTIFFRACLLYAHPPVNKYIEYTFGWLSQKFMIHVYPGCTENSDWILHFAFGKSLRHIYVSLRPLFSIIGFEMAWTTTDANFYSKTTLNSPPDRERCAKFSTKFFLLSVNTSPGNYYSTDRGRLAA